MKATVGTQTPLGQLLVQAGKITKAQLDQALAEQAKKPGERIGEVLVRLEMVDQYDLIEILAQQYGLPAVKLTRYLVDHQLFDAFPQRFLEKNLVCPMFRVEETTTVAMADPTNIFVLDEIRRMVGGKVQACLASGPNILEAVRMKANLGDAFGIDDIVESVAEEDVQVLEEASGEVDNLEEVSGLSPVVRLVNYVVFKAVADGASDIHIELDEETLVVRNRVDGILRTVLTPPKTLHAAVVSRIKVMANLDISERRLPQDGRIRVAFQRRAVDLRVSTLPCHHGEKVVIRILDKDAMMLDLEAIGVSKDLLESIDAQIKRPHGMMLVTGPTGSGKSTTLYSMLGRIKDPGINICTVENPVEFNIRGINQVQTNEKIGMTFATVLRSLLRQDPDVIMVGEIRDKDTAQMAVQASLTGHLVLSTLHTNDAVSAVTRLVNMEVEPYLLGASLQGVLAQRLVRRICSHCRQPFCPMGQTHQALKDKGFDVDALFTGTGCDSCRGTGFSGRIGLFELFVIDDETRDLIVGGADLSRLRRRAREIGVRSLFEDGVRKVREGITTAEEVLRVTVA